MFLIQPCRVIDFLAVELSASTDRELTMRAGLDGTLVLRTKRIHTQAMFNVQAHAIQSNV